MSTPESEHRRPLRLSRRAALRLLGGVGAAAILAACGTQGGSSAPTAATGVPSGATAPTATTAAAPVTTAPTATGAASAPSGSPGAAAGPTGIRIVNTGARLPTEKVTFRWVDSGDQKAVFWKEFFPAYQQAHPNITVQYDALPWNEIAKVVPLGIQNGNAQDVFQVPLNVTGAQAVREGWVAPLDDVIPTFAAWHQAFPPGSFVEGITTFAGKTYTVPITTNKRHGSLTLYNLAHLKNAGYDPAAKPLTWDEFRAAAKKITEQGRGQYYGLIFEGAQTGRWANFVSTLGRMAGAAGSGGDSTDSNINWQTGEYTYTSEPYLAAIELLLGLKADNSVFPGSLSLNAPQARAQMPQGVAGMLVQGPWNIPQWQREAPTFAFGVASPPVPTSGAPLPLHYGPGGSNLLWVYARSPHKAIAGDILHYVGSEEGQLAWSGIVGVADGPIFPKAQQAIADPLARKANELFDQQLRLGPSPVVRNPDVAQVSLELKNVTPDFGQVVQGLYTGQLRDPKRTMQDLQDRSEKELERAIKAAADKGAKVSRDDWKFPNWDPTRDYTQEDYDALKR